MFSIARSRYTLPTQFTFLATNALGVLLSTIYNAKTPDLYPNNAHHKLGWLVTWVLSAQAVVGLVGRVAGAFNKSHGEDARAHATERRSFIPISEAAMDEHHRFHSGQYSPLCRTSNDSGQGTELNTESLRSHSVSSTPGALASPVGEMARKEFVEDEDDIEADSPALPRCGAVHNLATRIGSKMSSRAWKVMVFVYNLVDRTSMLLGFITLATGIVTFARFFVSLIGSVASKQAKADCYAGGKPTIYRPGALDQRRRFLLAWRDNPWSMGRLFWRAWMGEFSLSNAF